MNVFVLAGTPSHTSRGLASEVFGIFCDRSALWQAPTMFLFAAANHVYTHTHMCTQAHTHPLHSISISFVELNQSHLSRQISVSFVVTHVSFVETISISFVEIFRSLKDEIE
jgi:hypothetical protein